MSTEMRFTTERRDEQRPGGWTQYKTDSTKENEKKSVACLRAVVRKKDEEKSEGLGKLFV
jgi:hypothetical protein